MDQASKDLLMREFRVSAAAIELAEEAEAEVRAEHERLDDIMIFNQYKVLSALQRNRISDMHFAWQTGYGLNDVGRDALERVYADTFHTEAALVRPIIVSGTHALAIAYLGTLRPGDELIYCSGAPYDTLEEIIGKRGGKDQGSLRDYGVAYKEVELLPDGSIDLEGVRSAITPKTRMVAVQRAMGYGWRRALPMEEIERWVSFVKGINKDIICMVDNCYGEFLDYRDPADVGADIMAGSLIKNPGGGIALSGGYVAGRKELIDRVQYRMTSPGIGAELGLMFGQTRTMLQGLFLAPRVVNGAVKGSVLCGRVFEKLGYEICPGVGDKRSDIIQAVRLKSAEAVLSFSRGVQKASPVDAHVSPTFGEMAGYPDPIVMACGAFIQGSSIELSCDGPMREPYNVYFQGGLTYEHSKLGVIMALNELMKDGLISL